MGKRLNIVPMSNHVSDVERYEIRTVKSNKLVNDNKGHGFETKFKAYLSIQHLCKRKKKDEKRRNNI